MGLASISVTSRSGARALRAFATVAPPAPPPTITTLASVRAIAKERSQGPAAALTPAAAASLPSSRLDGPGMPPPSWPIGNGSLLPLRACRREQLNRRLQSSDISVGGHPA